MNGTHATVADAIGQLSDDQLQAQLLEGVSRTFALTIPQLPQALYKAVANAYLLCRIVDTIEDEVALTSEQKRAFCRDFEAVVKGRADAASFSRRLAPLLSQQTIPAEHELIRCVPRVIAITHSLDQPQIDALAECVEIMAKGMADFQDKDLSAGLANLDEMDRYCYYVAGVVGEMLTKLFCHYSPEIAKNRDTMMKLAVSFGQGLQMTNILKDVWDDHQRGVSWLPRDIFAAYGYDLAQLSPQNNNAAFRAAYGEVVGVAHGHLRNALEYTMLIPSHETGMREFCLWALGMAVLTLRKINGNLAFTQSSQAKITRRSVKATIAASRLARRCNFLLKLLFNLAGIGYPRPKPRCLRRPIAPTINWTHRQGDIRIC
ncbi:phytoene/squalene synthase family protein [Methylogaea oryzae]|uniref:phytoene/squalene synthase family protein n=1 Tax=Methylogaea oryzae TaxID=1295382 RepID=UPI0006CF678D|nr:phytoene/squalene synthase family protein [Methylogaea oryzae]